MGGGGDSGGRLAHMLSDRGRVLLPHFIVGTIKSNETGPDWVTLSLTRRANPGSSHTLHITVQYQLRTRATRDPHEACDYSANKDGQWPAVVLEVR